MTFNQIIAKRTKQLLNKHQWTQFTLSMRSGIPRSTVCHILKGHGEAIKTITLLNICRGFGITITEFFDDPCFALENIDDD